MASQLVGAVVGTFKVGTGVKVGPPTFLPAKPQLTLRGKTFQVVITTDLKQVNPGKAGLRLGFADISHPPKEYAVKVSSTVSPSPVAPPELILTGKFFRTVTPGRQITAKPQMTLNGKTFRINLNQQPRIAKAKLILQGGNLGKIGKAGLVPTTPVSRILTPSPVQDQGNLVPTPAYTELLVPTVEEFV